MPMYGLVIKSVRMNLLVQITVSGHIMVYGLRFLCIKLTNKLRSNCWNMSVIPYVIPDICVRYVLTLQESWLMKNSQTGPGAYVRNKAKVMREINDRTILLQNVYIRVNIRLSVSLCMHPNLRIVSAKYGTSSLRLNIYPTFAIR